MYNFEFTLKRAYSNSNCCFHRSEKHALAHNSQAHTRIHAHACIYVFTPTNSHLQTCANYFKKYVK